MSASKETIQVIKREYNSHPSSSLLVTSICYSFLFHNKKEDIEFLFEQSKLFFLNNLRVGISLGVFDFFEGEDIRTVKNYTNEFLNYLINKL